LMKFARNTLYSLSIRRMIRFVSTYRDILVL
jgi:hypothetical protein